MQNALLLAIGAGNMAHLLNHSCDPNCNSRNLATCSPIDGQLQEHIIIFARREIAVGEELTYDYRQVAL